MDMRYIDDQMELHCELLDIANQSFDRIVLYYKVILDSFFSDNVYNLGRFFIAKYFAQYIVNRATHIDRCQLLHSLSEKFEEKWQSSISPDSTLD
jgi:hypothetical protein